MQQPHPPIWVGAASAQSIQHAARSGLRLFLDQVATFDEIEQRLAIYCTAQLQTGVTPHPDDVALTRPLLLAQNATEREPLLESHVGTLGFWPTALTKHSKTRFIRIRKVAGLVLKQVQFSAKRTSASNAFDVCLKLVFSRCC